MTDAPSSTPRFGALLRDHRVRAGLSQEALAELAGISANAISALERGYRRTPQRDTLALLASALALTIVERTAFEAAAVRPQLPRYLPAVKSPDGASRAAFTLPLSLATFVGRGRELEEITALLREYRFVTIGGAGGIGKTQTALQVATSIEPENRALGFAGLAPIADPSLIVATIAAAVGVPKSADGSTVDSIVAHLRSLPFLLILDNCEHVIDEAAAAAEQLLTRVPALRILATSREPLRVAGERVYRLPPLEVPEVTPGDSLQAEKAATYGAIALFADRARAVDYRFALTDENAPLVARICRRLDGIPLAIELTAARVNLLSLEALAHKLDDRLRLLTGGERMALPRQQTMRATIDWSFKLLSTAEQRLFARLSVFAAGCTLAGAATVCANDGETESNVFVALSSLVDKSLVSAELEGDRPRYQLGESFREYARERLAERAETQVMTHRQVRLALELAKELECAYESEPDDLWRALVPDELDNWRTALQWTLSERGDVVLGQRLAAELRVAWQYFTPLEGARWLTLARQLVDAETPLEVQAALDYASAITAWSVRDHNAHLSYSERAVAQYRALGDELGTARAQSILAHALTSLGRPAEALPLLQEALAAARSTGTSRLIAYVVRGLGWNSCINGGDIVAARAYYSEAVDIYESLGANLNAAFTLNDLSECEAVAGNVELALTYASKAVSTLQTFDEMPLVAQALDNIALYLILLDRFDEAERCAREALALALEYHRESGHLNVLAAQALQHLAATAALRDGSRADPASTSVRAARILGFVDARLSAMGATRLNNQERREYDRVLAALQTVLGAAGLTIGLAEGAAMSESEAIAQATGAR
ncbi:MAG TPA: helix-turn-helix domain-containing protein [Candidatus Cybelea sp.]|nr:helix-turn-helix domain-containing protein [Candidatus Cybelea sp.]